MVAGLEKFRESLGAYSESYIIIGGTACDLILSRLLYEPRATMDAILAHLKRDGHPLKRWYYGHFHNSWHSEIDGVWFKMLDIMELLEVPRIVNE